MADRAMALGQEPRVLVTRVAFSHLGRHVIGGCALSDVGWNDGFHEVGVLRLCHGFKSYSRHRMSMDVLRRGFRRSTCHFMESSIAEVSARVAIRGSDIRTLRSVLVHVTPNGQSAFSYIRVA